jgi:SAM-dependent methyltransferase
VDVESVDAIVAGQAWHWFDSWAAVVEAERVLRPGGGVGLLGTSTTSRFAGLRTLRAWDVSQSFDRNPHLRENGVPRLTAGLGGQI